MASRLADHLHRRRMAYALSALAGTLYFVGFAGFDQWYLTWFALVPLLWVLDDATLTWRETVALSWFMGTITYVGGYTWLTGMLRDFGHLPLPLAVLGMLLLCIAQSVLLVIWGWSVQRLVHRYGAPIVWVAPVMLVLAEWTVPALFPTYISNSQYRQILFIQSLDLWGPLGLSFLLVLASSVLYETLAWRLRRDRRFPKVAWIVLIALLGGNAIYGAGALVSIDDEVANVEERVRVGMVQVNMGIYEKDENPREGLRRHREQSLELERQGVDLIVWPESGYNYAIAASTKTVASRVLGPITTPLLFGGVRWVKGKRGDPDREIYNSAFLVDGDGWIQGTYDKIFLLAFGEYLPFGDWFPILYEWSPHSGRFNRGQRIEPLTLNGISYGVMICYEDILPRFVRKLMEKEPDILVNITNDAWFGKSREPTIHLALAVYRAVEHRRFLVRSTNTGISAFIDPAGRILQQTPIFARANLVQEVAPLKGRTIYARLGDWPAYLCLGALIFWLRDPLRRIVRRLRGRKGAARADSKAATSGGEAAKKSGKRNKKNKKKR